MSNDTDLIISIAAATAVMIILSGGIIYFVIIYRRKQQVFEQERQAFKLALHKTEIEIKEQTLSDISRELHDNIGQIASLIKINLNLVLPHLSLNDREKVSESLDLLKQLIKDIQSLSVSLKGENLKRFGLLKMIEKDVEQYQRSIGLIHFSAPPELPELDYAIEIFLYRMSQEIFNNIIKHAQASEAEVFIEAVTNSLIFRITDNGKGFLVSEENNGSGLINLKERCEIIGAKLEIESEPGHGTQITIKLDWVK
jgi:two-component system, NarL family, sensor kinase